MSEGATRPPSGVTHFGLPEDDPLAARLFPALPGEVKWGLGRTERMLASLGAPHRAYSVLHVAGTNGKGSVARIWAEALVSAGFRTGLYTSPHLISFRERILVDGLPVADELLEEWSRDLRPFLVREAPSFFEAATVLAFLALARSEVDVAVVEVGMGGRLDATNVVTPVVTAVTNVGLEHTGMLGSTLEEIAGEKAGILKPGVPVFTAADQPSVLGVLGREAAQREALLRRVPFPEGRFTLDGCELTLMTQRWGALDLQSPLVGDHQLHNLALAVAALEALPPRLPLTGPAVREGVARARIPGRFQVERDVGRTFIFDVAHNPAGFRALTTTLRALGSPRPRVGVVGILSDKPVAEMLGELGPHLDHLVLTLPRSAPESRRWDPEVAADGVTHEDVHILPVLGSAIGLAKRLAGPSGTVLVTGSSHTVGEALEEVGKIPREALPTPFYPG